MKIEEIDINLIQPYENNPRNNENSVDKVAKSIKEFGFKVPIIIDKDNIIVAGHTRYLAAKKNEMDKLPCIRADDLTDEQVKAFRLVDNKVTEFSEWDLDLLNMELDDLKEFDIDMSEFGFDLDFDVSGNEQVEDDDFEVELPKEAKSKLGDIYQLGRHKLMCGDSTDINAVEKLLNGVAVDLFLTDPPYNVDYEGDTAEHLKIENDSMSDENFLIFLTNAFNCAAKFMKDGACFYIWYSSSQTLNFWQACANAKLDIKQNLIWAKSHFVISRHDYHYKHEPCLYGWKGGAKHNWYSDRKQTTLLEFDKALRNAEHPTMKPVELFNYQICNNTTKDDVVLDLFGGSGTTLIACEQNGRSSYLMELDPKYCDVIVERWEKLTNQKAKLIRNGTV